MAGPIAQRGMFRIAAFAGVACSLWAARAQPDPAPESYHITRYTTEQGLPQNSVRALLQTRDGYLWVGTLAGLARFDGVRFRVFNVSNTPEMLNDAIDSLAEDLQDGSLWINAGQRLLRYHRHRFERFDELQGVPHAFGDVWPARDGGLWYSPHAGLLVRLQQRTVRTWQLLPRYTPSGSDEILAHRIRQIEEEDDGRLLVLMYCNLFRFDPATRALTPLGLPSATDTSYRHFLRQADGTLLVAAREGLWRGSAGRWERIESVPAGSQQCPSRILPARDGGCWIRWEGDVPWINESPPRLARLRNGRSERLDLSGLPEYPLNRFLQDREGHLWLGTESGLCRLQPHTVRVHAREQGMRNDQVKALTLGPDGTVWLGTEQGVSGIRDGRVTNLPPVEPPSGFGRAEGLLADRRGRIWYGARANSVAVLEQGGWGAPRELGEGWIRTLHEDRQGRIWVGTDRGVVWLDETGAVRRLTNGLSHLDVRVIHEDARGDLWFGTYGGGLNRLRNGEITSYATSLGDYNNRAWWIHEDADGVFWVATRNGLNRFVPPADGEVRNPKAESRNTTAAVAVTIRDGQGAINNPNGRFFTFTTAHGLHENTVNNIQEDDFGHLWLSGRQGIYRVARGELNEVAAGRLTRVQVLAFGEADGLLNSQCNGGVNQPSGCKDQAGRIWFPTARGAVMIDPRTIRRNEVPPPVVVEQVKADGEIVYGDGVASEPGGHAAKSEIRNPKSETDPKREIRNHQRLDPAAGMLRLAPGRARVLEIHYTANTFAAPNRVRFKYRLDGHDRDWHFDDENRRVAFYTSLWPGRYTFRVAACNNHGVWSEQPAEFAFTLASYLWQTWWFYLLAGAAAIALAAAVQAYRLRWQRRLLRLEQRQVLADERARIARDLHDDLGTALTGLALEMDVLRRGACGELRRPGVGAQQGRQRAGEGNAGFPTGDQRADWKGGVPDPSGLPLDRRLAEAATRIRALAQHMREVVWTVNPRCDTVASFASFLEQQAGQFGEADGLRCRIEFPEEVPATPLDGQTRHELALAVREAIANVVRHASATEIVVGLEITAAQLRVRIADNGRGFDATTNPTFGQGLANMRARMERIGGRCDYRSAPGAGTTVELCVPLNQAASGPPITP